MLQAVQIETQAKQQGLARLHSRRATGGSGRELAIDRIEHRFDQSPASTRTNPMGVSWEAVLTPLGKLPQSFQGPRRALCESRNC